MIDELDSLGRMQSKCMKCDATYIAESSHGTGNMLRHIRSCKGKVYRDIGQMILQSNASGAVENRPSTFKFDEFREILALAIARHNLPLQFVEYEGIRAVFSYLCPEVKHVSRRTIKNDIMKIHAKEKTKLDELLKRAPGRIAITSDCWSSITIDGYISLTAHFIEKNWRLGKRVLAFSFIPPPHTGAALAKKMTCLLKQWGIEKRIASITLDNASSNDSMVETLKYDLDLVSNGDYFHVRCCAHILNLIVQEGLKEIDDAVLKVRECVKYCKGSQGRKQKFLQCVQHVSLESSRGLRQDVPTRWNSTYMMLDSALFYKKALLHMKATDANFVHCLNSDEWNRIEKICKFLSVFHEVTLAFSGTKYPTSNLYFPNVLKVRMLLKEHMGSADRFLKTMATKMNEKFEKYWSDFSTIMAIAVVFDPRYKLQVVEWAYKKVYEQTADFELELFKNKLFSLYNEYASSTPTSTTKHDENVRNAPAIVDQASDSYMEVIYTLKVLFFQFNIIKCYCLFKLFTFFSLLFFFF
ncbi:putative AC transposase [Bienertia sinuspersici]